MAPKSLTFISILFFTFSNLWIAGQDIKLIFERSETIDINADSTVLRDINGDVCSVAIFKSDNPGIKFYSNLGIEKVDFDSSEYKVWFPSTVSLLKIVVPGFPLYEQPVDKNQGIAVHIFRLNIPVSVKVLTYKSDSANSVTISTFPVVAKVNDGDTFLGRTPLTLNYAELRSGSTVSLSKYKYFHREIPADTLKLHSSYQVTMESFSVRKRYYLILTGGILATLGNPVFGFQAGKLGKFGYYISGKASMSMGSTTFKKIDEISYALAGGISTSLFITNIYIGAGYSSRYVEEGYIYQVNEPRVYKKFLIDFGLILNLSPNFIMSLNSNLTRNYSPIGMDYIPFDLSLGIGWAF